MIFYALAALGAVAVVFAWVALSLVIQTYAWRWVDWHDARRSQRADG